MSFISLNIAEPILKSLAEEGYTEPTPIQSQAIPVALKGTDILGCAQTGTGKTAAFAIPILQNLSARKSGNQNRKIRSLIVTPTRELAIQIDESFQNYGRHTGLNGTVIFGGVNQKSQVKKLHRGIDILTATPGRLLDLMNQGYITLNDIEIFVLDEADRMLDMGFIHDVKKIIAALPRKRQTLFFSATMPPEIVKLANSILTNPVSVHVTPESPTVDAIRQALYYVDKGNKKNLLIDVLKDDAITSALVFTRTKHGANKVVKMLKESNIGAEAIHGNKSQAARQQALGNFKDQVTRVLVATDIAARGIDVDELQYVINYEIPNIPETYIHRIGRTGRAGSDGTALSFCDALEKVFLRDIEKLIGKKIPVVEGHDYPLTDHNPPPPEQQQHRPPRSGNRNGSGHGRNAGSNGTNGSSKNRMHTRSGASSNSTNGGTGGAAGRNGEVSRNSGNDSTGNSRHSSSNPSKPVDKKRRWGRR
ncbi:MAG: DEAD/DEAH box helicase [Balneolaceae bacterium]|nr:MAG: DEAD/DEAH box helicase [Balneolaceae bacterium]